MRADRPFRGTFIGSLARLLSRTLWAIVLTYTYTHTHTHTHTHSSDVRAAMKELDFDELDLPLEQFMMAQRKVTAQEKKDAKAKKEASASSSTNASQVGEGAEMETVEEEEE